MQKGFTLLEVIVVVVIIALLSVIFIANFRGGEQQFALQRSVHKLAQDLRRAQGLALAGQEFKGIFQGGYGIHFVETPESEKTGKYILFVDCNNNNTFDGEAATPCDDCTGASCIEDIFSEEVEEIPLENEIKISKLKPTFPLDIVFYPPDPETTINNDPSISSASITLNFNGQTKKITVNTAGLIDIE
jgi:prepilin-type N-terminal cleavage/methylation domain-containing protein